MENIKEIIANNLQTLRKNRKLTQSEVGEAVHYSDKAVSRWEKGESLPDIETLQKLAELFEVETGYLFKEHSSTPIIPSSSKQQSINKIVCVALSVLIVWLTALLIFLYLNIYNDIVCWQIFIWAIPSSALVLTYFNRIWGSKKYSIYISSIFIWSFIAGIYCQFVRYNLWLIFFVGAPVQAVVVLNSFIKNIKKNEKQE